MSLVRKMVITILVITLTSCNSSKSLEIVEASADFVCELSDNMEDIGSLESISVFDEGFAVISSPSKVMLYGFDGQQKCEIGRSGKAHLEYNMPYIVRAYGDSIYIWSANSMKFISYTKEGKPVSEFSYKSAIRDFLPTDDKIIIYNKGLRTDSVIDIYSKTEGKVVQSQGNSTEEHKVLLSRTSMAPFLYDEGDVFYTQKGDMYISAYNVETETSSSEFNLTSDTFLCDPVKNADDFLKDRRKRGEYLMKSSMSLAIIPSSKGNLLLTLEGYEQDAGNRTIDYSNRYFGLYNVKKGKPVKYFTYDSLGSMYLMSVHNGSLYFIKRKDKGTDDEVYELYKLVI